MKLRIALFVGIVVTLAASSACDRQTMTAGTGPSHADTADQVIIGLWSNLSNEGIRQAVLESDTAFVFQDGTLFELREVDLTFYTDQGTESAVLTSREGTYNTRTNQMEARGDVVLESADGRRLMSEQLRYDQARDEISSDSAFVSIEGDRRLEGIGFRANSDVSRFQCLSACRAGGPVTLPQATGPAPVQPDTTTPPR
ncbi:MAG TPA: LPS export ABC transporter periplasmic protein LptC [Gemmatimonadaceae bacterium]|nr:LPS export ABC transporter periplasmic protein LptC [Gemmatimonadaceae bacterium]